MYLWRLCGVLLEKIWRKVCIFKKYGYLCSVLSVRYTMHFALTTTNKHF